MGGKETGQKWQAYEAVRSYALSLNVYGHFGKTIQFQYPKLHKPFFWVSTSSVCVCIQVTTTMLSTFAPYINKKVH